jgi:glycosyltransferase involved in cell wall biosynthesis
MRILLLSPGYRGDASISGIADRLATEFLASGHVVAMQSDEYLWGTSACEPRRDVEWLKLSIPNAKPVTWRHLERLLRQPRGTRELVEGLKRWKPDVVNYQVTSWDQIPIVTHACRAAGVSLVISFYGIWARRKLGDKALRALKDACAITTVSVFVKRYFEQLSPVAHNAHVIISAVDHEAAAAAVPFKRDRAYIFSAARLCLDQKAIDLLVLAFSKIAKRYPDLDLLITGEGPDREKLEELIDSCELRERVHLLGLRPREELWSLYKGSALFAMPSRGDSKWGEGLGLVFLEAMACGIPVIGARVGGVPEIIHDGESGVLVEPNDPEALASAIARLLDDRELRIRLGEQGKQFVSRFRWPDVAKCYLEVYASCLG